MRNSHCKVVMRLCAIAFWHFLCNCLFGLRSLRSTPEDSSVPLFLDTLNKHASGLYIFMGSVFGKLTSGSDQPAPADVQLPLGCHLSPISVKWDSSATDSSGSSASSSPDTPAKLQFESSGHQLSPTVLNLTFNVIESQDGSPSLQTARFVQGHKHKILQETVNDRTLINALYGTSLPNSPSLRYKRKCFTRSYLEHHGMTAKQAKQSVQHMSTEQLYNAFAGFDIQPPATLDTIPLDSDDYWEAVLDLSDTQASQGPMLLASCVVIPEPDPELS